MVEKGTKMSHGLEKQVSKGKIFKETVEEYAKESSIPGYKYITGENSINRYFWYLVHICILATAVVMVQITWNQFMTNPVITTVEKFNTYLIEDVAMPAISVCKANKISKNRAQMYAEELSIKSGLPRDEIFENIKMLARLYDYEQPANRDAPLTFQMFLNQYDPGIDGYYDSHAKLNMLQTPCSEILSNCWLHGKKKVCEDLFVAEHTMEGQCCVFNYISQSSVKSNILKENHNQPIKAGDVRTGGLVFQLLWNTSDDMPKEATDTHLTSGVKILVSLPTDFPDTTSGGLTEHYVEPGIEEFLSISTTTTFTTEEVRKYAIKERGCIFRQETETIFGSYSYSDCVMDCKIKSITKLCYCIPFNYISVFRGSSYPQCTLANLKCLNKYRGKWEIMYPIGYEGDMLEKEKQYSIYCPNCVPACSDTLYTVKTDAGDIFQNGNIVKNFSIVHVSFENAFGISNKQDVYFTWYDMIGLFGGLCSSIMGISFISVVEILYHSTYVFCKKLLRNNSQGDS